MREDGTRGNGDEDSNPERRRPADVFTARWRAGMPAAFDFAVTSGLRDDCLHNAASDADAHLLQYEAFKCSYLDTEAQCQDEGVSFIPMVVDACGGGWGPEARKVWTQLAKATALTSGELESTSAVQALQRMSLTLHRENARAVLRRFQSPLTCSTHLLSAVATVAEASSENNTN